MMIALRTDPDEAGMIRALWRRTETLAAAAISLTLVTAVLLLQNHPHSGQAAVAKITLAREYLVKFTTSSASETYLGGIPAAGGALGDVEGQRGPRCPEQDGSVQNLVYISHQGVAERLGCPINHTMACFYCFDASLPELEAPPNGMLVTVDDCDGIYRPLPADEGRGWCIRAGLRPAWVLDTIAKNHQSAFLAPVLLTGKLNGPNPTHQANLHFHAIWIWMRASNIFPGELHMIIDFPEKSWSPGRFGTGLASSLGKIEWLLDFNSGYVFFKQLQFSIPNGQYFPFDLKHMTIDAPPDIKFMELAENVKHRLLPAPGVADQLHTPASRVIPAGALSDQDAAPGKSVVEVGEATAKAVRIVLARRTAPDNRVWANVEELARELVAEYGMEVEVVSFGAITFREQVEKVATAQVLVGVTGSDLVNLMFLPPHGSVVEIFPAVDKQGVFVPELANMAQMLGKNHFPFVTHNNLTAVNEGESRLLYRVQALNVGPVSNLAALVNHAAFQTLYGSSLKHSSCQFSEGMVRCERK